MNVNTENRYTLRYLSTTVQLRPDHLETFRKLQAIPPARGDPEPNVLRLRFTSGKVSHTDCDGHVKQVQSKH